VSLLSLLFKHTIYLSLFLSSSIILPPTHNRPYPSYPPTTRTTTTPSPATPTVETAVRWQLDHHLGFPHSFMSSIRFAPLTGYQEAWKRLGCFLPGKILIFAGTTDPIIIHHELRTDADTLLGREKFEWRVSGGAHDFRLSSRGRW
jgi:hypothetical protein